MLSGGSLLFGSFCSSGPATGADASTIGEQRRDNHALTTDDENHFVAELIAGLGGYPAYYAHVGPANAAGSTAPDLTVPTSLSQPTRPRSTPSHVREQPDGRGLLDQAGDGDPRAPKPPSATVKGQYRDSQRPG